MQKHTILRTAAGIGVEQALAPSMTATTPARPPATCR